MNGEVVVNAFDGGSGRQARHRNYHSRIIYPSSVSEFQHFHPPHSSVATGRRRWAQLFTLTLYSDRGLPQRWYQRAPSKAEDCRGKVDERVAPLSATQSTPKASESIKSARRGIWHLIIKQNRLCSVHFRTAQADIRSTTETAVTHHINSFQVYLTVCCFVWFFFLSFLQEHSIRRRPWSLVFQARARWDKSLWHHTPPSWC